MQKKIKPVIRSYYKEDNLTIFNGDCLDVMSRMQPESIDLILTDPPYGSTRCSWDSIIPLEPMWEQLKRIIKPNGAIVLFGSQPFTTNLIASNMNGFAFCWVWDKCFAGNFVQAKRQPLKDHEDIIVFSKNGKQPAYYPQMIVRDKPIKNGGNKQTQAIPIARTDVAKKFGESKKTYTEKYPTSQIRFNCREGRGLHPTQKPVALMEYLIKTYSHEREVVLDFTMGSGTTLVAAKKLGRKAIGIELSKEYCDIAIQRLHEIK